MIFFQGVMRRWAFPRRDGAVPRAVIQRHDLWRKLIEKVR